MNNSIEYLIDDKDITWPGDKGLKFKRNPKWETVQWIDPEDGIENLNFFPMNIIFY